MRVPSAWHKSLIAMAGVSLCTTAHCQQPKAAPFYAQSFATKPSAKALSVIGRLLFFDADLSASGHSACATCHDPNHAYAAPNNLPVQLAGLNGDRAGVRAVPSLRYGQTIPPFTAHFIEDDGDDSIDQGPAGGRTWDGRAQSMHVQAQLPLLSEFEMANADPQAVVLKVEHGRYAAQFRRIFGEHIFEDAALAFKAVLLALETYQQEPQEFYPYSSQYDAYLRGTASLSPQQLRGLAVFNDPKRGNCARCHPSARRAGAFPQFSDFGYAALGVPRNAAIPANRNPQYFDLGLCGPWRTDLNSHSEYCGMFRTPSLRNVATRAVFFHNGVVHSLEEAVKFYASRDSNPEKWYPRAGVAILKFDDLPKSFVENLDTRSAFDEPRAAQERMDDQEVADVVAFLQALTDGYPTAP